MNSCLQKNQTGLWNHTIHKINSKWLKELNIRLKTIKFLEIKLCSRLFTTGLSNFNFWGGGHTSSGKRQDKWYLINLKECSNHYTIALISHASKVMLKILQARLQKHMNCEHPDVQAGFRKGRGTRDQIANICWINKKAREFQKKTSISALFTMPKSLTVWITRNCGKFWKGCEYQNTRPASWEMYMQVRKQQLELHMEQQTGSK